MTNESNHQSGPLIRRIKVDGFRGFRGPLELELDADVVLVSGSNGAGKTSFADALNVTLNRGRIDDRIRFQGDEPREIWRDAGAYVRLDETTIDPASFPAASRRTSPGRPPLASFASVFYQADPKFSLDELHTLARSEAPAWVETVRRAIGDAQRDIQHEVEGFRPDSLPSEAEEAGRRLTFVQEVAEVRPPSATSTKKLDVLGQLRNGNLPKRWRTQFGAAMGDRALPASDALERLVALVDEELASVRISARVTVPRASDVLPIAWPVADGIDPVVVLVDSGDVDAWIARTSAGTWVVPVANEPLARALRTVADDLRSRSAETLDDERAIAAAVLAIRPRSEAPVEARLRDVVRSARTWAEALERLGIDVPLELGALLTSITDAETKLQSNLDELETRVEKRVDALRDLSRERRAQRDAAVAIERALDLGEQLGANPRTLAWAQTRASAGATATLSSVRRAHDEYLHTLRSEVDTRAADDVRALERFRDALARWAKFERQSQEWDQGRRRAGAHRAAIEASEPYVATFKAFVPPKGESLLDPPALTNVELAALARAANRLLTLTGLGALWTLELEAKSNGVVVPRLRPADAPKGTLVDAANLSTGQQTQLALSIALALNLLAEDLVDHRVLVFDDVGTSLDLGQLPAFAFVLRALAYARSPTWRRQVFLASHHEDMSDRWLDLLAPPPDSGQRLLVHAFEMWDRTKGPSVATYELEPSGATEGELGASVGGRPSLEPTDRQIFARRVSDGVKWVMRRL